MKLFLLLIIPVFCCAQHDSQKYVRLKKLPKPDFEKAVNDSIVKLEPGGLSRFLTTLREEYNTNLKPFNSNLTNKLNGCEWPNEMFILLDLLITEKTDTVILQNILNERKQVWDSGQWSEKFWKVIRVNKIDVNEGPYYSVNEKGEKEYDIKLLLEEKRKSGEIGENPLLEVDYMIVSYPENTFLETLEKLKIRDVSIVPKAKAVGMFGKRGIDGSVKILTKN